MLIRPWSRTDDMTKDEFSSCWEPICSSVFYKGWTIVLVHDPLVQYYTCPIVYLLLTDALLWTASYTCYTTSCPLVHRGHPWERAIMWKINVYIFVYIIVILCICICVFFSLFSSFSLFFFATCPSLIGYQSRQSMFLR